MSGNFKMNNRLKLSELNGLVKDTIEEAFPATIWVIAEISEMKINRSGHCYMVLVEKDEQGDSIIAQARATIWSYTFRMIQPYFETTAGRPLSEGIKVLLNVSVEFHQLYGFSLNVRDIDPSYTLGDIVRRRREIIARLEEDGVLGMNKELELPLVPQKIAVISSATAAGFQDFTDQLINNEFDIKFYLRLFPAIMQGEKAEESIINALEQIYVYEDFFDLVVIIRGGGSQADLSCFDSYNMAYHITQFPLPVITGIGHEKDDTIADLVANTRLKTPTAVAEFIISGAARFESNLNDLQSRLLTATESVISDTKLHLERIVRLFSPLVHEKISSEKNSLGRYMWKIESTVKALIVNKEHSFDRIREKLDRSIHNYLFDKERELDERIKFIFQYSSKGLENERNKQEYFIRNLVNAYHNIINKHNYRLQIAEEKAKLLDPKRILMRGYSITSVNGKVIKKIKSVKKGDIITTRLSDGKIESEVIHN